MASTFRVRGYTVERLLGSGSSGEVWRARVGSSGAAVALKRIPTPGAEQRERAQAEAALLCALDHPNLVRLHAFVPAADAVVLVLDLADGGSLADLLATRGRLAPGEVVTALAPVAAAVHYLHGEGVVHGDVSAANVLFTAEGAPLLADVGVARLVGTVAGVEATPAYVDPAVAAGCIPGPPSDVFMLAGVALHALTGEPPWPAPDAAAALELAARGVLADVPERLAAAGVPPAMSAVLSRALDVDPHRRGTAADLALELRHSARPVAVELAAGRARLPARPAAPSGPRHAARPAGESPPVAGDAARPAFERPHPVGDGREPPTRLVGPRPRPVIPRPPRRRRLPVARSAAALLVVAGVAAGGVAWARSAGPAADHAPRAATQPRAQVQTLAPDSVAATASPSLPAPPPPAAPSAPASHSPPPPPPPERRWLRALAGLDALRARAFAERDPRLLRRVYLPGPLVAADTATLARAAPVGCRLLGVRSRFTGARVRAGADSATVTVTATLPPSRLVCGGRLRATVPGAGPSRLRLELRRTAAGVRIAAQTLVAG